MYLKYVRMYGLVVRLSKMTGNISVKCSGRIKKKNLERQSVAEVKGGKSSD